MNEAFSLIFGELVSNIYSTWKIYLVNGGHRRRAGSLAFTFDE
jgi:hypothetical protein